MHKRFDELKQVDIVEAYAYAAYKTLEELLNMHIYSDEEQRNIKLPAETPVTTDISPVILDLGVACDVCKKIFKTKAAMASHKSRMHKNGKI